MLDKFSKFFILIDTDFVSSDMENDQIGGVPEGEFGKFCVRFKNAEFAASFSKAYKNAVGNDGTLCDVILVQQESQIPIKSPGGPEQEPGVVSPEPKSPPPQATFSFGDKPAAAATSFGGFSFGSGQAPASSGFNFGGSRPVL